MEHVRTGIRGWLVVRRDPDTTDLWDSFRWPGYLVRYVTSLTGHTGARLATAARTRLVSCNYGGFLPGLCTGT